MGPGTVGFYLNIGLVLGPMWEASKRRRALSADDLPATTDLLRFDRLRVPGPDREETWLLTERTLPDMIDLLERAVEEQLPAQLSVLDRETTLRNPEGLFKARAWRYRAWILADAGPSQELDDLLTWAESEGYHAVHLDPIREWATARTSSTRWVLDQSRGSEG
ncbi:hypothetical protein J2S43_007181 [Catenuloplanes nepalensis]|uniref:DUF695 domain-containing protein n=2 Tax=Catenuloplanes nepalensis TaxID=587533 RepID=A0ABT9N4P7_9ACTN|nr:hypothetical protein [Catenuloplanes nepalensis]